MTRGNIKFPNGYSGYSSSKFYQYFTDMLIRSKKGKLKCAFTRTLKSYLKFEQVIGPIPKRMRVPTVGRYDHSKGYVFDSSKKRWNFRWQAMVDNLSENGIAVGKLKKSGFQTGAAGRAAITSPKHSTKKQHTCPKCGLVGKGPWMFREHFNRCRTND